MTTPWTPARRHAKRKRAATVGQGDQIVYFAVSILMAIMSQHDGGGCGYLEVENKKNGEVSLKAATLCAASTSAHIRRRTIVWM